MRATAENLLANLLEQETAWPRGAFGLEAARGRSGVVDAFLRDLFDEIDAPSGVALVALGGYGRGELAPGSDIDLLILHAGIDGIDRIAERIFYPLWDAKLTVGHAVRTVNECVSEARARLDVLASMLDARFVAGEEWLEADMAEAVLRIANKDRRGFAERLSEDMRLRHATYASVSHHLEPDLKEGSGGLRDIHSMRWLGHVSGDEARTGPSQEVVEAEEFFVRLRSALHLLTGRRTDKLYLEHQPPLARELGYDARPQWSGPDLLMRDVFRHGRHVEGDVSSVLAVALEEDAPGNRLPAPVPEILTQATEWTPSVRDAFANLLAAGDARSFDSLERSGALQRLIPEWEQVRFRAQRDPYHRFTVDIHLVECACEIARLLDDPGDDPMIGESAAAISDRTGVLLGALLHDIGKVGLGGHVAIGSKVAREILGRTGYPSQTQELARFMVSEHLLLPDTATRRDLADENLIVDVAARVGDSQKLAALFLLSLADAAATGPNASTPWRKALVRELAAKIQHVLERGEAGPETAANLAARAEAIRATFSGANEEAVEAFLLRVPRAYVLGVDPARAVQDFSLIQNRVGAMEVRTAAHEGERRDTFWLSVVAADRPGLLARVAGALTLSQLSILSAQVFTTEDGLALDHFVVASPFTEEIGEERWREFRSILRKALEGRLSLEYRVKDKRAHYPEPRRGIPVEVTVENDASDFFSVIEVGAADRIGLLFDITRTLFELSLDVHIAKVATYGDRVIDAFYVRDVLGSKITDEDHAAEIVRAISARLTE